MDLRGLDTKSISGSEIILAGKAKILEVMVNTRGIVYNKGLNTDDTTVIVNAERRADIKTSGSKPKVRAGGFIYIYGNPKYVGRDKVFSGKIKLWIS